MGEDPSMYESEWDELASRLGVVLDAIGWGCEHVQLTIRPVHQPRTTSTEPPTP